MPKVTVMVGGSMGWAGRAVVDGERADRVGHGGLRHARKRDDVARYGFVDVLLRESAERLDTW